MQKYNPMVLLGKLFENKKFLIAFSIVCAVIFWLVIDITENPTREVTFSNVPVTILDCEDDSGNILSVVGDYTDKVSVTVSGPGYIVGNISNEDVTVSVSSYADVTKPGTFVLGLTATTSTSGCSVSKITPSYVQVVYDYDTATDVTVEADISAILPYIESDCEIYKSVLKNNSNGLDITALSVSGPSKVLSTVSKVVVKPIIEAGTETALSSTNNYKPQLDFYDAEGNVVDSSQFVYNTDTYLRVVVYKSAEVSLVPTFANMPDVYNSAPLGLPKHSISINNEATGNNEKIKTVNIKGPIDTVNELMVSGLKLAPIDFKEIKPGKTQFNVSFVLTEGVEVVDGIEEVTVSLDLGYITSKTIEIQPSDIKYNNLAGSLSGSTTYKKKISIVVCGKSSALKNINASNISAWVDCSGFDSASIETKPINIELSTGLEAWINSVEPSEISITVK